MPLPQLPSGWTARGDLPNVDPAAATEEQMGFFDEDMLQLVDPTQTFAIDVGWYPACEISGRFVCRLVQSDQWEQPLDELETRISADVHEWLENAVNDVVNRIGEPDTISPLAVATVLLPIALMPSDAPISHLPTNVAEPASPPPYSHYSVRAREEAIS